MNPNSIRLVCALLLLGATMPAQATTYRWVDDKGVVHYSDRPQPGADKVNLPSAQTYNSGSPASKTPVPAPPVVSAPPAVSAPLGAVATGECLITAPQNEQTFNNAYSLTITAKGPMPGPTIGEVRLLLDGGLNQKGPASEFVVNPIDRGMHRAIVVFMNAGGGELCRTKPVTFYVRKPTIIRPAARPKAKP